MPPSIGLPPSPLSATRPQYLIFFITGNPGLIAYYTPFLTTLGKHLSTDNGSRPQYHIYGQSLAGFEDSDPLSASGPYGLQYQIDYTIAALTTKVSSTRLDGVVLIGHSVGAYIAMEVLRSQAVVNKSSDLKLKGAILLFPTVTEIAQSPSGRKASPLMRIPHFPGVFSGLAKGLLWCFPDFVLRPVVKMVTGMPDQARDITVGFLRSRMGILQAIYMAKDELETITADRWDEDIWGVEHTDSPESKEVPNLVFYFGERDHWVADHTRDALIASRGAVEKDGGDGSSSSRPKMLIDKEGVPHSFCIDHSDIIADKTAAWIQEIADATFFMNRSTAT